MSAAAALPFEDADPWRDTSAIHGPLSPALLAACPILDPVNQRSVDDRYDAEDWLAERYAAAAEAAWEAHLEERGGWPTPEPSDWN